ncbi:Crp/Fnr family transcriptional regulator [Betaproteobacteria bacterium]|nr:Crp/Fnr family transcriptional regulator [Betaproteobacteria bacterium]GHU45875.1 Crp/Fnr family transcriptional regulator [Betaproteobacteria bacterium]
MPDLTQRLAALPLFTGMSPDEIACIMRDAKEIRVDKGAFLFNKGDPCKGFHLLLSGRVKLAVISPQGQEKVVELIKPDQTFGEALMFAEKPYIVSAQALADSHLLHFSRRVVFEELERNPRLARKMIAGLSMRLHRLVADVEDYSLHSGKQRIVGYLLREAEGDEIDNTTPKRAVVIKLSINKSTLASRLNMTQEHFSRLLRELIDLGLFSVKGHSIHIPDLEKLRQFGE